MNTLKSMSPVLRAGTQIPATEVLSAWHSVLRIAAIERSTFTCVRQMAVPTINFAATIRCNMFQRRIFLGSGYGKRALGCTSPTLISIPAHGRR